MKKSFLLICGLLSISTLVGCGSTQHTHNYGKINEVAATCTKSGVKEHYVCSGCDKIFDASKNETTLEKLTINKLDHSYDEGVITKSPTCVKTGIKTFSCQRPGCGHVRTETIKALDHSYDEGVVVKAPTCTEDGLVLYTCQRPGCGHVEKEIIKALDHDYDYDNPEIIQAPTYIKNGKGHAKCKRSGCTMYEDVVLEPARYIVKESDKTLRMIDDDFKVVNFSDIQLQNLDQLKEGTYARVTIETMLEQEKPDIITFSGDIINWQTPTQLYKALCDLMDTYKVPYYMIFGNHDRSHASASELAAIVNASEYGFMEKGPDMENTYGNYVLDIKNKNGVVVHKIFMMDSGSNYTAKEEDFEYVTDPVDGVKYNTHNDLKIYGHEKYDNIKGKQITWYEEQLNGFEYESSLITHIPLKQYIYAYEDYKTAVKNKDQAAIDAMAPIGTMRQFEGVCSSPFDSGLFDKMVELGSTKNFISCHDHVNDFSLLYQGIRLTYGVKCGDGYNWLPDGSMNGCTTLTINANGVATSNQVYLDLVP